jgi:hypothetical protein
MSLSRFTSGPPGALQKLNAMVDALNELVNMRGDDKFITLRKGPSGALVSLNPYEVIRLVPKVQGQLGQPVPVTNNSSSPVPIGGLMFSNGSAGADYQHLGIVQPVYPGISADLLIAVGPIAAYNAANPSASNGLGWPMDGCVHPIYDPDNILSVNIRYGAQAGSWAPMQFDLGPIMGAFRVSLDGPAQGLLIGEQGDGIFVVDPAGVATGFYDTVICGSDVTLASGSVAGDFTGLSA